MPTETDFSTNTLAGTQWVLSTLDGAAAIEAAQATLNFDAEGRITGSDGCNRFFGPYRVAGDALVFSQLGGTLMACPPDMMEQARSFTRALMSTNTFSMAGGTLTLLDENGAALATFSVLNTNLAGTHWNVTGYNNGKQAVVSVLRDTSLTLEFSDAEPGTDARVAGSAGCNRFFGAFTQGAQGDDAIAIGPLASTRKLCPAPEGVMEQEAQFLKALETAATWRMDGDKLELRTAEGALAASLRRAK
jgi:heat shock protein HslJ